VRDLFKLNRYFKKYKGTVILGALFLILGNCFLVGIPILIREAINHVERIVQQHGTEFNGLLDVLSHHNLGWDLTRTALWLVGAVVMYALLLFATRQTLIVASRRIEYDIRNEVFEHLLKLPQSFFSSWNSGDIFVRATEDISRVRDYFGPGVMYTINTVSRAGIIITIMVIVNAQLTFWALLPLPVLTILAYKLSGYINERSNIIQQQYSRIANRAQETFSSMRLIKAYVREDHQQKLFERESEEFRSQKLKLAFVESIFFPMLNLLIGLSVVLVVWKGGIMVIDKKILVGNIAEFLIYVAYLTWPVASLGYTLNLLQRSAASNTRIQELLRIPTEIEDDEDTDHSITDLKGAIEFRDVHFKYLSSKHETLKGISFRVEPGQHVAFVGRTGSGKSTLVELIPRLYNAGSGEILIDNHPISRIPLKVLRDHIGFVPQETFLFSDTIAENVAFGVKNATPEQIEKAAEKAQILENILEFEKKFETILGERGITLSGGQKQRTSIARALIKNPDILIFDDSLNAVDTKTEDAILDHLNNEMRGKTTIMISHRISTIRHADVIYVLKDGQIVESGNHQTLLERDGFYADMFHKQQLEQELEQI